ncbi:MAG: nucleotidyltransferase substrate binding protein [Treponema sp.]|nr:nucleotidyltransferase substrate binding protein [Treponema sp.]
MEPNGQTEDIRWKQRFQNYKKALAVLRRGLALEKERELSELERSGLVQAFEFTQELSWKVLKDYLEYQGVSGIFGSRDAYRVAFNMGLISDGEKWMEMLKARNLSSHTYEEETSLKLVHDIAETFASCFISLEETFDALSR